MVPAADAGQRQYRRRTRAGLHDREPGLSDRAPSLPGWEVLGHEDGVFNPWFFWVLLFAVFGLFSLNWKPDHFLPAGLLVYFFALSMVTYASPRLRLPVDPFFILFASAGWVAAQRRLESRGKTSILLSVVLVSSAAGYIYSDFIKDSCRSILVLCGIW